MLKLIYTEANLHLEQIATPLEMLVAQRVILALRIGQPLQIEPSRAAFLLSAHTPGLAQLKASLCFEPNPVVTVRPVDADYVEISLQGSWLASGTNAHEGMFITAFTDRTEFLIYKLWHLTQVQISFLV